MSAIRSLSRQFQEILSEILLNNIAKIGPIVSVLSQNTLNAKISTAWILYKDENNITMMCLPWSFILMVLPRVLSRSKFGYQENLRPMIGLLELPML